MMLTEKSRDEFEPTYGSNILITNPEIVVGEVKWVFEELKL